MRFPLPPKLTATQADTQNSQTSWRLRSPSEECEQPLGGDPGRQRAALLQSTPLGGPKNPGSWRADREAPKFLFAHPPAFSEKAKCVPAKRRRGSHHPRFLLCEIPPWPLAPYSPLQSRLPLQTIEAPEPSATRLHFLFLRFAFAAQSIGCNSRALRQNYLLPSKRLQGYK